MIIPSNQQSLVTKKCSKCAETKSLKMYSKDKNTKDGLQYYCKDCMKIESRKQREKRKEKGICIICGCRPARAGLTVCSFCSERQVFYDKRHKSRKSKRGECRQCRSQVKDGHVLCCLCLEGARLRSKQRIIDFSARVGDYFNNTCFICKNYSLHTEVYDCHHLNPDLKEKDISKMVCKDWDTVVVLELEKCVYLCRNCHARLHAGRFDEDIKSGKLILIPGKVDIRQVVNG